MNFYCYDDDMRSRYVYGLGRNGKYVECYVTYEFLVGTNLNRVMVQEKVVELLCKMWERETGEHVAYSKPQHPHEGWHFIITPKKSWWQKLKAFLRQIVTWGGKRGKR